MSTAELKPDSPTALVTAEQLLVDFRNERCELVEGKVISMAPPGFGHGAISGSITERLAAYVRQHDLGIVATNDSGFLLGTDPDTVLGADAAFVTKDRIESIGTPEGYFPEAPALAIEVVSPNDTAEQVHDKALRWLGAGTQLVWIVYPKNRTVTVYRSAQDVKVLSSEDALTGDDVVPGFSVKVAELFAGLK